MKISEIMQAISEMKPRSAWGRGVRLYALEILEDLDQGHDIVGSPADKKMLLNGASDWLQYSWGGCSLCYNADIAARLCTPSEYKRTREGTRRPNRLEEWLDCQAKALHQAANAILLIAKNPN